MTCMAPTSELFHAEKYYPIPERLNWVRKHQIENEFCSDEEIHVVEYNAHEKQTLDRLKEIQDLSMRATLLNAEHRYAEESLTPNRKRRISPEYNSSPDRTDFFPIDNGHYKLTLSQFAVAAGEQEPLSYQENDEDVEEILMRLRHGHDDYYQNPHSSAHPSSFPPMLFPPHHNQMRTYYPPSNVLPPPPPANKGSLFHILSQDDNTPLPQHHNHHSHQHPHHHLHHPYSMNVHNNIHMRKLFFEDGLMESSDEQYLEHPKKKIRREGGGKVKSPLKSIVVSSNDDVQEKETVAAGLCFKTHKPKVQREYYYAKLSKTIFRWTCCGSQAKTHPDA